MFGKKNKNRCIAFIAFLKKILELKEIFDDSQVQTIVNVKTQPKSALPHMSEIILSHFKQHYSCPSA